MTILECDHNALTEGTFLMVGERSGEQFKVMMDGLQCAVCGFTTIDSKQSSRFTQLVSDAYREAHGRLTGPQIRSRRNQLGMNQDQFSEYLGVGSASVKRWEAGQVQDKAMDELIRLKTDPDAARRNLKALEQQVPEHCVLSNVVIGGQNVELSFLLWQPRYGEQAPMRLDRSILSLFEDEGPVLAA